MTQYDFIARMEGFKGKQIIHCYDEIAALAKAHGYLINVSDPMINTHNIDNEPNRLNVRTDKDSVIVSFTIG